MCDVVFVYAVALFFEPFEQSCVCARAGVHRCRLYVAWAHSYCRLPLGPARLFIRNCAVWLSPSLTATAGDRISPRLPPGASTRATGARQTCDGYSPQMLSILACAPARSQLRGISPIEPGPILAAEEALSSDYASGDASGVRKAAAGTDSDASPSWISLSKGKAGAARVQGTAHGQFQAAFNPHPSLVVSRVYSGPGNMEERSRAAGA